MRRRARSSSTIHCTDSDEYLASTSSSSAKRQSRSSSTGRHGCVSPHGRRALKSRSCQTLGVDFLRTRTPPPIPPLPGSRAATLKSTSATTHETPGGRSVHSMGSEEGGGVRRRVRSSSKKRSAPPTPGKSPASGLDKAKASSAQALAKPHSGPSNEHDKANTNCSNAPDKMIIAPAKATNKANINLFKAPVKKSPKKALNSNEKNPTMSNKRAVKELDKENPSISQNRSGASVKTDPTDPHKSGSERVLVVKSARGTASLSPMSLRRYQSSPRRSASRSPDNRATKVESKENSAQNQEKKETPQCANVNTEEYSSQIQENKKEKAPKCADTVREKNNIQETNKESSSPTNKTESTSSLQSVDKDASFDTNNATDAKKYQEENEANEILMKLVSSEDSEEFSSSSEQLDNNINDWKEKMHESKSVQEISKAKSDGTTDDSGNVEMKGSDSSQIDTKNQDKSLSDAKKKYPVEASGDSVYKTTVEPFPSAKPKQSVRERMEKISNANIFTKKLPSSASKSPKDNVSSSSEDERMLEKPKMKKTPSPSVKTKLRNLTTEMKESSKLFKKPSKKKETPSPTSSASGEEKDKDAAVKMSTSPSVFHRLANVMKESTHLSQIRKEREDQKKPETKERKDYRKPETLPLEDDEDHEGSKPSNKKEAMKSKLSALQSKVSHALTTKSPKTENPENDESEDSSPAKSPPPRPEHHASKTLKFKSSVIDNQDPKGSEPSSTKESMRSKLSSLQTKVSHALTTKSPKSENPKNESEDSSPAKSPPPSPVHHASKHLKSKISSMDDQDSRRSEPSDTKESMKSKLSAMQSKVSHAISAKASKSENPQNESEDSSPAKSPPPSPEHHASKYLKSKISSKHDQDPKRSDPSYTKEAMKFKLSALQSKVSHALTTKSPKSESPQNESKDSSPAKSPPPSPEHHASKSLKSKMSSMLKSASKLAHLTPKQDDGADPDSEKPNQECQVSPNGARPKRSITMPRSTSIKTNMTDVLRRSSSNLSLTPKSGQGSRSASPASSRKSPSRHLSPAPKRPPPPKNISKIIHSLESKSPSKEKGKLVSKDDKDYVNVSKRFQGNESKQEECKDDVTRKRQISIEMDEEGENLKVEETRLEDTAKKAPARPTAKPRVRREPKSPSANKGIQCNPESLSDHELTSKSMDEKASASEHKSKSMGKSGAKFFNKYKNKMIKTINTTTHKIHDMKKKHDKVHPETSDDGEIYVSESDYEKSEEESYTLASTDKSSSEMHPPAQAKRDQEKGRKAILESDEKLTKRKPSASTRSKQSSFVRNVSMSTDTNWSENDSSIALSEKKHQRKSPRKDVSVKKHSHSHMAAKNSKTNDLDLGNSPSRKSSKETKSRDVNSPPEDKKTKESKKGIVGKSETKEMKTSEADKHKTGKDNPGYSQEDRKSPVHKIPEEERPPTLNVRQKTEAFELLSPSKTKPKVLKSPKRLGLGGGKDHKADEPKVLESSKYVITKEKPSHVFKQETKASKAFEGNVNNSNASDNSNNSCQPERVERLGRKREARPRNIRSQTKLQQLISRKRKFPNAGPTGSADKNPFGEDEDWGNEHEYDNPLDDDGAEGVPVRALYDYEGAEEDELSFKTGEVFVKLRDRDDQGWCKGRKDGQVGLYPDNYVEAI